MIVKILLCSLCSVLAILPSTDLKAVILSTPHTVKMEICRHKVENRKANLPSYIVKDTETYGINTYEYNVIKGRLDLNSVGNTSMTTIVT